MPDGLSYADAVRLLGGQKSRCVETFDKLAGWALLAGSGPAPALLGLFDAKAEFVRLGRDLLRRLAEQRSGLSRYGRTQRLEAAHAVIQVTAFFEVLDEADLPFRFADLEIGKAEQLALGGARVGDPSEITELMFGAAAVVPGPGFSYPRLRDLLHRYYTLLADRLDRHVTGLAAWERIDSDRQRAFRAVLGAVPELAVDRHRDLLTVLAVDFPEVAYWSGLHEHEATRAEVRHLAAGLDGLRRVLDDISTGRAPDDRRSALARSHAAKLDRPIVESDEAPDGLRVPRLGEAYVPPRCRVALLDQAALPSDERWWAAQEVRDDLTDLLTAHLTTSVATRAPLLVLGQPGSGKSVLTRVLAAQLPAADFLVVRVALREVSAETDLQDQIEQAIRHETSERVDWPALVRSAGDALPVVLLDGFDELLQATGVTQTDYLLQVARFQRREAEQGRAVAMVVTTRTSVADRAKPPPETVALRLEPFDETRVHRWVATWNRVNADKFPALGVPRLDPDAVLAHRELAEQPLLLLMLALYAAAGNDLRATSGLRRSELYERLLTSFAQREVEKHRPGLPDRDRDRAAEDELRRLAVVAFGMFNRSAQWITEDDLETDLAALPFLAGPRTAGGGSDLRIPLRPAEIVLGRFFFVHRSQATRNDRRVATYEFLHATFGEFLIARTTALVLRDLTAVAAASTLRPDVDDDPLAALLSFATLTNRAPVVTFLHEIVGSWDADRRADAADVLLRLFRTVHDPRPPRQFATYRPLSVAVPQRHAEYSANLLVLVLCTAGEVIGRQLYPDVEDTRWWWARQALLWRSQLVDNEYQSLVDAVALDRLDGDTGGDIRLHLATPDWQPPPVDPWWAYGRNRFKGLRTFSRVDFEAVRRSTHFECGLGGTDLLVHALEPLGEQIPLGFEGLTAGPVAASRSWWHALLRMWLGPQSPIEPAEQEDRYRSVIQAIRFPTHEKRQLVPLLLDRLATDVTVPPRLAGQVLAVVLQQVDRWDVASASAFVRCCLAFLGHDLETDETLAKLLDTLAGRTRSAVRPQVELLLVEACVRLTELNRRTYQWPATEYARLAPLLAPTRPDLVERLRRLVTPGNPVDHGVVVGD